MVSVGDLGPDSLPGVEVDWYGLLKRITESMEDSTAVYRIRVDYLVIFCCLILLIFVVTRNWMENHLFFVNWIDCMVFYIFLSLFVYLSSFFYLPYYRLNLIFPFCLNSIYFLDLLYGQTAAQFLGQHSRISQLYNRCSTYSITGIWGTHGQCFIFLEIWLSFCSLIDLYFFFLIFHSILCYAAPPLFSTFLFFESI